MADSVQFLARGAPGWWEGRRGHRGRRRRRSRSRAGDRVLTRDRSSTQSSSAAGAPAGNARGCSQGVACATPPWRAGTPSRTLAGRAAVAARTDMDGSRVTAATKGVEERERVICGSPEIPATECSSPAAGSRMPQQVRERSRDAPELSGRGPCSGRHPRRRLGFQIHFAFARHRHPRRPPRRAGRDEPGGAAGQRRGPRARVDDLRQRGRLQPAQPAKAGYDDEPPRGRQPRASSAVRPSDERANERAAEGIADVSPRTPPRRRTCSRSACCRGCTGVRPMSPSAGSRRFGGPQAVAEANLRRFRAGRSSARRPNCSTCSTRSAATDMPPGTYRNVNGNDRDPRDSSPRGVRSGCRSCSAAYPITPASELLHELARHASGVRTIQAEDEIAAAGWRSAPRSGARSASRRRAGPGMDLKAEMVGLAVMLELPMVIIDVQRAGPSTGMPTKTEQSDLLMALYGRHGESPLPIAAPARPRKCFDAAIEAARRGALPHARDPADRPLPRQLLRAVADPRRRNAARDRPALRERQRPGRIEFVAYSRDAETCAALGGAGHARARAPDRRHREVPARRRSPTTAANHELMTRPAPRTIAGIVEARRARARRRPDAELLVLGWGSSWGTLARRRAPAARRRAPDRPRAVPQPQPAAGEHWARCCALQARSRRGDERRAARDGSCAPSSLRRHRQLRDHPGAAAARRRDGTGAARTAMNAEASR